jgi:hypothetical protein
MRLKRKLTKIILNCLVLTACGLFLSPVVLAAPTPKTDGINGSSSTTSPCDDPARGVKCAPDGTTALPIDDTTAKEKAAAASDSRGGEAVAPVKPVTDDGTIGDDCADKDVKKCLENDKFIGILKTIVKFLSAGVGILVILAIIFGGIRYTIAGDDAAAVTAAKKQIYNAIFALVVFALTFSFLQWLIPGGII